MESYHIFGTIIVASLRILMVHLYRWKKGAYESNYHRISISDNT
mgnify:CR=1 FL=1